MLYLSLAFSLLFLEVLEKFIRIPRYNLILLERLSILKNHISLPLVLVEVIVVVTLVLHLLVKRDVQAYDLLAALSDLRLQLNVELLLDVTQLF